MAAHSEKTEVSWPPVSQEERTLYELLFYSQGPVDGYILGNGARDLLLKSGLSLTVLSQIWNLADVSNDNVLSVHEFVIIMHLIRGTMQSMTVPKTLPRSLTPPKTTPVSLPPMSQHERDAYLRAFQMLDYKGSGVIDGDVAAEVLKSSNLTSDLLAHIWNLSDFGRDGTLNREEFAIACHLLRYVKKGEPCGELNGPADIFQYAPQHISALSLLARKRRVAEYEEHKQRLMSLKECRKGQALRETRRLELVKAKVKLFQELFDLLVALDKNPEVGKLQQALTKEQADVDKQEEIVARLKKEHERVRQETVKIILGEQKFNNDISIIKRDTDELNKRLAATHTHATKDADPFHQLYEQRREKRQGSTIKDLDKIEIHIPFEFSPFDLAVTPETLPSGAKILEKGNNSNVLPAEVKSVLADLKEFGEDFMDVWGGGINSQPDHRGHLEDDELFKEVHDLTEDNWPDWDWSRDGLLGLTDEQVVKLKVKLTDLRDELKKLNSEGGRIIFRNPEDYSARQKAREEEEKGRVQRSAISRLKGTGSTRTRDAAAHRYSYSGARSVSVDTPDTTRAAREYRLNRRRSQNIDLQQSADIRPDESRHSMLQSQLSAKSPSQDVHGIPKTDNSVLTLRSSRRKDDLSLELASIALGRPIQVEHAPVPVSSERAKRNEQQTKAGQPIEEGQKHLSKSKSLDYTSSSVLGTQSTDESNKPEAPLRSSKKARAPPPPDTVSPLVSPGSPVAQSFATTPVVSAVAQSLTTTPVVSPVAQSFSTTPVVTTGSQQQIGKAPPQTEANQQRFHVNDPTSEALLNNSITETTQAQISEGRKEESLPENKPQRPPRLKKRLSSVDGVKGTSTDPELTANNQRTDVISPDHSTDIIQTVLKSSTETAASETSPAPKKKAVDDKQLIINTSILEQQNSEVDAANVEVKKRSAEISKSTESLKDFDARGPDPLNQPNLVFEESMNKAADQQVSGSAPDKLEIPNHSVDADDFDPLPPPLPTSPPPLPNSTAPFIPTGGMLSPDTNHLEEEEVVVEYTIPIKMSGSGFLSAATKDAPTPQTKDTTTPQTSWDGMSDIFGLTLAHTQVTSLESHAPVSPVPQTDLHESGRVPAALILDSDSSDDSGVNKGVNYQLFSSGTSDHLMSSLSSPSDDIAVRAARSTDSTESAFDETFSSSSSSSLKTSPRPQTLLDDSGPQASGGPAAGSTPSKVHSNPVLTLSSPSKENAPSEESALSSRSQEIVHKARHFANMVQPKVIVRRDKEVQIEGDFSQDTLQTLELQRRAVISQSTVKRKVNPALSPSADQEEKLFQDSVQGQERAAKSSNPSEYGYIYSTERPAPPPEVGWTDKPTDDHRVNLYSENVIKEGDTTESVDRESIANLTTTKKQWENIFTTHGTGQGETSIKKKATPKWEVRLPYKEKHSPQVVDSEIKETKMSSKVIDTESAIEREIRLAHEREEMLRREKEQRSKTNEKQKGQGQTILAAYEEVSAESESYQPAYNELTEADRGTDPWGVGSNGRHQEEEESEGEGQDTNPDESIIEREIRLQREREAEIARMRQLHSGVSTKQQEQPPPETVVQPVSKAKVEDVNHNHKKDVSYEAHDGESIIARELRELKEREEEMRKMRNSLHGTQINDGESHAAPNNQKPSTLAVTSSQHTVQTSPSPGHVVSQRDASPAQGTWQRDVSPFVSQKRRESQDSNSSHSTGRTPSESTPASRNVRVQPMVDDNDDEKPDYFKKTETPIEREMRLARERENELRRQKGLPELTPDSDYYSSYGTGSEASTSTTVVRPRSIGQPSDTMKKFASSRLQQEIMQQKEREVALRKEGKIISTSEEHIEPLKYMEVAGVDKVDGKEKRNFVTKRSSAAYSEPEVISSQQDVTSPAGQPNKRASVSGVGQLFSYKEFKQTAESKIERELREMREREEELRQRRTEATGESPR
ncbi:unnamed protein product [Lymnaea stagnalis]|uniref:Uncharacterized protein n=1 Tax=Lymnaea stagnalis TaxID=6523 RepID=A0AAV2I550_LYMST